MTALSLSGSAAQSKIQRFPGDCDFFERVHIKADAREAAHVHSHPIRSPMQSFGIGLVHGLAGSAGVAILIVAALTGASGLLVAATSWQPRPMLTPAPVP